MSDWVAVGLILVISVIGTIIITKRVDRHERYKWHRLSPVEKDAEIFRIVQEAQRDFQNRSESG